MIGVLNVDRTKIIFSPKEVKINIDSYNDNVSFEVDGQIFLKVHTDDKNTFLTMKDKFQSIFEDYLGVFTRFNDRDIIFDLSGYADEINRLCRRN